MNKGKIIQVMGPVVDVAFENGNLPHIQDALTVMNNGKRCVMEVAQHIGGDVVRCIMLASSEGLYKDMEVEATGQGIAVPVGEKIVVECHVGPKNEVYCIFDTVSKSFVGDLTGNHLIWYDNDITTAIYSFWSDIYTYDGSIIKSYDLAENESIYDLAFSDHNTKLIVTITCDDGTERTEIIDL